MHLSLLLEMVADGMADRRILGDRERGMAAAELVRRSRRVAAELAQRPGRQIVLIDVNSTAVPLVLFGSVLAGRPFVPLNYRLADSQLRRLLERTAPATVIAGAGVADRIAGVDGIEIVGRSELLAAAEREDGIDGPATGSEDPSAIAVMLYTSGTTGEPKASVLRNQNLASYLLGSVEYGSAGEDEAALIAVPPYHIAGVSAVLSSFYAGRRMVYLEAFDPRDWVAAVREQRVTHAMVVPTMLNRVLDVIEADDGGLPSLRTLSYGGGPMPTAVIDRALGLLPDVGFVNAYGLTETSSTIALLDPDDHRRAWSSTEPAERARLGSVGRPLPSVEVSIRDAAGQEVPTGERGEVWVRGEQVSGEYLDADRRVEGGWFPTRDAGHLDEAGYLFVHGRLDDVIVRGGENLSPGEIEGVLLEHPAVAAAAVVGIPDEEWGERVVAAVQLVDGVSPVDEEALRDHVRSRLRSAKTPEHIQIRRELPFNETGKLLRRALRDELAAVLSA